MMVIAMAAQSLLADVVLPSVYNHDMVIQRDLKVPVWGWADPGEKVKVSFAGQTHETVADDQAKWSIHLNPMQASAEDRNLTVSGTENTVVVARVLVGDVWICSGQSNMEWSVSASDKATQDAANAKDGNKNIRLFRVPNHIQALQPLADVQGSWTRATTHQIRAFSAVGFSFGAKLEEALNIPIGLIDTSWGGTAIESWISPEGYRSISHPVPEPNEQQKASLAHSQQQVANVMEQWKKKSNYASKSSQSIPSPIVSEMSQNGIGGIYNAMVAGLTPFGVKGAIWYQGESNRGRVYPDYATKLKALVQGWRENFTSDKLSFYLVHIAPFDYNRGNRSADDTILCENIWRSQYKAASEIEHCGVIPTHDTIDGNLKDIHPRDKLTVGQRLAAMALQKDYQQKVVASGPVFNKAEVQGSKIKVTFKQVDQGLTTSNSKEPSHFEISEDGINFLPARATIEGNDVLVWNDTIKSPAHVRMGWSEVAIPNLKDKNGWPVFQFTTVVK